MEKYLDFLNRISYQQAELLIGEGIFSPHKSLSDKVNVENSFRTFYGDTVVFDLDRQTKERISALIEKLYEAVPECFCNKLDSHTLHMTLHDLSVFVKKEEAVSMTAENETKLIELLKDNPISLQTIRMKTKFIINMLDISLVLTLVPADEKEWDKLQKLYTLLDNVKICDYPFLTPHITLAYYNYNGFNASSLAKLKGIVRDLNQQSFEITLNTNKLFYQLTTYPTITLSGALGNSAGKGAEQQVFRNGNHYILLYGNIIRLIYLFGSRMSGVRVSSLRPY